MNDAKLDSLLKSGLLAISEADWRQAQKVLARRLETVAQVGQKRLNLFLLSIAAASGGYQQSANQLWASAQAAELNGETLRYLDLELSPTDVRQSTVLALEKTWWGFNGWNEPAPLALELSSTPQEPDWKKVVEACRTGDHRFLEANYSDHFNNRHPDSAVLWNLLALAYLEDGDVRTYDEMAHNQLPFDPSTLIHPELEKALRSQGFEDTLLAMRSGAWVQRLEGASPDRSGPSGATALTFQEWKELMLEGFAFLGLHRQHDAARIFQTVCAQEIDPFRRLLAKNALSLACFRTGDYTEAETLYMEFRSLLEGCEEEQTPQTLRLYQSWLKSVDAFPPEGHEYFTPFESQSDWNREAQLPVPEMDFAKATGDILGHLGEGDFVGALHVLQRVQISLPSLPSKERYLLILFSLCCFVNEGDYIEVNALDEELKNLEGSVRFEADERQDLVDGLRWAGYELLARRLEDSATGETPVINPWQDLLRSKSFPKSFS